jgi:hypothetical protein
MSASLGSCRVARFSSLGVERSHPCRYVRCTSSHCCTPARRTSTYALASGSSGSGVCNVLKQKIPRRLVLKDQHHALQEHLVSASDDLAHVSMGAPLPVADDAHCLWKAQFVRQVGERFVWRCHKGY